MGSAESEEYDQTLDSVLVGPVPAGRHMFVFQVSFFLDQNDGSCSFMFLEHFLQKILVVLLKGSSFFPSFCLDQMGNK